MYTEYLFTKFCYPLSYKIPTVLKFIGTQISIWQLANNFYFLYFVFISLKKKKFKCVCYKIKLNRAQWIK